MSADLWSGVTASMTPNVPAAATNQARTSGLRGRSLVRARPPSAPASPASVAGK